MQNPACTLGLCELDSGEPPRYRNRHANPPSVPTSCSRVRTRRQMKLLEYQAKQTLASLGLAIPPGRVASTPEEAAEACAALGPVAVKAQVPVGGRGKAGGIKLAATPEDARAAAGQILGMDIKGFKV